MKLRVTFDVGNTEREALGRYHGRNRKASRAEVANWIVSLVEETLAGIVTDNEDVNGDDGEVDPSDDLT